MPGRGNGGIEEKAGQKKPGTVEGGKLIDEKKKNTTARGSRVEEPEGKQGDQIGPVAQRYRGKKKQQRGGKKRKERRKERRTETKAGKGQVGKRVPGGNILSKPKTSRRLDSSNKKTRADCIKKRGNLHGLRKQVETCGGAMGEREGKVDRQKSNEIAEN